MKVLRTNNTIISLEDVRRVNKYNHTTEHTSRGTKYSVEHCYIRIKYVDGSMEELDCGKNAEGIAMQDEIFDKICIALNENKEG